LQVALSYSQQPTSGLAQAGQYARMKNLCNFVSKFARQQGSETPRLRQAARRYLSG